MSIETKATIPDFAEVTLDGDSLYNSHVSIAGDEAPSKVHVLNSGMYAGTWLTSKAFSVTEWAMVSTAILLSPDEAEAIGWALINGAQEARNDPPEPFAEVPASAKHWFGGEPEA